MSAVASRLTHHHHRRRRRGCPILSVVAALVAGCASGPPGPATVDTRHDACAHCRMLVSDLRFAAQIVAPGEEPRFFDDVGCLRDDLGNHELPAGARVFVSDYRTKTWTPAGRAVYVASTIQTPMGSGLVAFTNAQDAAAAGLATSESVLSAAAVFGTRLPEEAP
jgi:copper chaperone NosL